MTRALVRSTLLAGLLLSLGCSERSTGLSPFQHVMELDGLTLQLELDRSSIPVGDSAVLTMRLRNGTGETARMSFGSSCQIMPYVETESGTIQYPGGGAWACLAVITNLDVPAHGEVTRTRVLHGVAQGEALLGASLPPGTYRAYAALEPSSRGPQLRSRTVELEVR